MKLFYYYAAIFGTAVVASAHQQQTDGEQVERGMMDAIVQLQGEMSEMKSTVTDLRQENAQLTKALNDLFGPEEEEAPNAPTAGGWFVNFDNDEQTPASNVRHRELAGFSLNKRISRAENNIVRLRNKLRFICNENDLDCDNGGGGGGGGGGGCKKDGDKCNKNDDCCKNLRCNNNDKCDDNCKKKNANCDKDSDCCSDLRCNNNDKCVDK